MALEGFLTDDTNKHCLRGAIECMPEVAEKRKSMQLRAVQIVLFEQQVQFDMDWDEPECIASVYAEASSLSQQVARERGVQDERDAR